MTCINKYFAISNTHNRPFGTTAAKNHLHLYDSRTKHSEKTMKVSISSEVSVLFCIVWFSVHLDRDTSVRPSFLEDVEEWNKKILFSLEEAVYIWTWDVQFVEKLLNMLFVHDGDDVIDMAFPYIFCLCRYVVMAVDSKALIQLSWTTFSTLTSNPNKTLSLHCSKEHKLSFSTTKTWKSPPIGIKFNRLPVIIHKSVTFIYLKNQDIWWNYTSANQKNRLSTKPSEECCPT